MASLVKQVLTLEHKPLTELRTLWRDIFHKEPPPYGKAYLVPRLAYRLQELALGGLSQKAQKQLDTLVAAMKQGKKSKSSSPSHLLPGTTLIRQWQGVEHAVTVAKGGFDYQGQRYKSLSAIARKITGTRWNGPLFFGLRSQGQAVVKHVTLQQQERRG